MKTGIEDLLIDALPHLVQEYGDYDIRFPHGYPDINCYGGSNTQLHFTFTAPKCGEKCSVIANNPYDPVQTGIIYNAHNVRLYPPAA